MICYNCDKTGSCTLFKCLKSTSSDFCINQCNDYKENNAKYKRIALYDELMSLIYDYFLDQIEGGYTNAEAEKVIKDALLNL